MAERLICNQQVGGSSPPGGFLNVPPIDLVKQNLQFEEEFLKAFSEIIRSGQFVLGENLRKFEEESAKYLGVKYSLGVNSGTDALVISLRALGIGKGDKVVVPAFSFFATVESVLLVGAEPIIVDIREDTFNIDPEAVKSLDGKFRCIIPVHLFGQMAEVERLKFEGVFILEDSAQAFGASRFGRKAGSWGDISAFSFYPTKNLSALGDGGLITTNNERFYEIAKALRIHGSFGDRYSNEMVGYNSRLDEIQASFLLIKLKKIDDWNKRRNEIAKIYDEALKDLVIIPKVLEGNYHIYHQYTIRTERRDELFEFLRKNGIYASIYYPKPLHLQKPLLDLGYKVGQFPISEKISREVLSLPIFPEMEDWQINYVIEKVREFFKG